MKRTLTIEQCLYLLAFLAGLFLRFFRLGLPALGEAEAGWALQALEVARGGAPQVGSQPGYALLTGLLFWLMGSTNFLARFLPALAGSLLVWLPYLLRGMDQDTDRLRNAGLVMAFGLALDPGLVALSRQAGSPVLAVSFTLLTLAMVLNRRWVLAGIFGGLALLAGPALAPGAAGLLLAWGVYRLLLRLGWVATAPLTWPAVGDLSAAWRKALLALGVTILVAGLLFLRVPQGLGALAQALPDYLQGWLQAGTVPALRLPAALVFYQPLALLFALIAAIRGWVAARSGLRTACLSQWLSLWALLALLLAVVYPSRQVADLAWMLIPLWGLAAVEIARHSPEHTDRPTRLVALGLAGLVLLLMIIAWINLVSLVRMNGNPLVYGIVVAGALLMAGIAAVLVAMGWSYPAARLGFHWGLILGLGLWVCSSTVALSWFHPNNPRELWTPYPAAGQISALSHTIRTLATWNTGFGDQIDVLVAVDSPALAWALRANPSVTFAASPSAAQSPSVVLTWKDQATPALSQAYRGQDFVLAWHPGWQNSLPSPLLPWLVYRQAPLVPQQVVLWARIDTFPGGALNLLEPAPEDAVQPAEEEQLVP